ncbi:MAG: pectate lyase, partial [Acidobacteria bacterium]|nr:pectate lyase [Acidobacteriota bacterium]
MKQAGFGVLIGCVGLAVLGATQAQPPAFPGAEGFGARTPGGRGGRVMIVRTLEDAGPGSFREAVTAPGPRVVVFAVGGLITLKSPVDITEPYLTIAGQSAPGDGVCTRGHQVSIRTHDVIVRYLRFRPGDILKAEVDALDIMGESHDVIIDHCSATWSVDENLSPSGAVSNITVQWCLIAESLNRSVHSKGAHGYGSLVRAVGGVTLHHNLWAHNSARNPRLGDNYGNPPWPVFDVRNNVIYDYGQIASGLTGDRLSANYVGNYIRPGPSSDRARGIIVLTDTADVTYFVQGNVVEGRDDWTADNTRLFDRTEFDGRRLVTVARTPFGTPAVRTTSASDALADVLAGVGATRPRRDAVDGRIVRQVEQRSGFIIDSQSQVGGWPEYRSVVPPPDSDSDGIPDAWERTHGLDPRNPADASKPVGRDGYTGIEVYLEELT